MPAKLGVVIGLIVLAALAPIHLVPPRFMHLYAMGILLYLPVVLSRTSAVRPAADRTLDLLAARRPSSGGRWGWVRVSAVHAAVVFPLFAGGFYLWQTLILRRAFVPTEPGAWLLESIALQTLMVALPEEYFFRGFLTELFSEKGKASPSAEVPSGTSGWMRRGLPAAPDLWANAFFALAHVVTYGEPVRATVFFSGLWFASVRRQSGSLYGAIAVHGLSNVLMQMLLGGR